MIRMLIALVVVALGMVLVLQSSRRLPEQVPTVSQEPTTYRTPVQEAEQVKALLEAQQDLVQRRAEQHR